MADNAAIASSKPSNPKDVIGSGKLPLELVPDTATAYMALSFLEGALKYGRFNWRIAGVRASIYRAAMERHMKKWWNGEDADPKTKVHHLASVMACCAIVLDAKAVGKLTDDRAPRADVGGLIEALEGTVVHLKELFKDHSPKQYTIADTPTTATEIAMRPELQVTRGEAARAAALADPEDTLEGRRAADARLWEHPESGVFVEAVRSPQKVLSPSLKCVRCGVSNGWRHSPDCPEAYD